MPTVTAALDALPFWQKHKQRQTCHRDSEPRVSLPKVILLASYAARREAPAHKCVMTRALNRVKCWDYLQAIFRGNDPCLDAET